MQLVGSRKARLIVLLLCSTALSCLQSPDKVACGQCQAGKRFIEIRIIPEGGAGLGRHGASKRPDGEESNARVGLGACAVEQIQVVEQLPESSWWVLVKISEDASKLVRTNRKRADFEVYVEGRLLLKERILPWHADNQLEAGAESRDGALQAAQALRRALLASASACGRKPPAAEVDIVTKPPPHNLLPAVDVSTPQPHCTAEAKKAGLEGELMIRVLIRRDGRIDPERSEFIDGREGPFARQVLAEIAETLRFRPARLRGEPQDSMEVIHLEYDCRMND